jgi:hypothetical protein
MVDEFDPVDDDEAAELAKDLETWANCATPDCEFKENRWAGVGRCSPCSERVLGAEEMERRYWATRESPTDRRWNGEVAT